MPFVVGILSSYLPEVNKLPLDAVLMVDLDNNKFLRVPGNDYELLPSKWLLVLLQALNATRAKLPPMSRQSMYYLAVCCVLCAVCCVLCAVCLCFVIILVLVLCACVWLVHGPDLPIASSI